MIFCINYFCPTFYDPTILLYIKHACIIQLVFEMEEWDWLRLLITKVELMQGSVRWVRKRGGEAVWEVDEGSVDKPRIGRGSAWERFWRRRCWSMHEGELLPKVSTPRIDVGFVFPLRSWRHDPLTFWWPSPWSSSPKSPQLDHREASSPCFYCQYWWPDSGQYSLSLSL